MVKKPSSSDGELDHRCKSSASELAHRISDVVGRLGGPNEAAGRVGSISGMQLRRYMSGESRPTFDVVAALAAASDVDLRWFADGVVRHGGEPDEAALELAIADVERVLAEEGAALKPTAKAKIVMIVYRTRQNAREGAEDAGTVRNLIRLVAS